MARVSKLYEWLLANPRATISFQDFERLLRAFGFTLERVTGSHRRYTHANIPWVLTVLPEGKDASAIKFADFLI